MVTLALYKGRGKIGNALIRWWTNSPYSHCELVVDGTCYSSSLMDGGVRSKRIDLTPDKWDFIELPWASADRVLDHYSKTAGEPYGWFDLTASQILNTGRDFTGASFCSEWCGAALGLPTPVLYSPATLKPIVEFVSGIENTA
jgi:hypothetical protein